MQERIAYQGITFDDVLLEPGYTDVVPREVDVRTQLTTRIRLNIPVLSSPMDTVQPIAEVMTRTNLVTAPEHTTLEAAERILMENKIEKLLLVDDNFKLKGLITIKDIDKLARFPNACKDQRGRLRVGAAVGVFDFERAASLIQAGVDVLVVASAHGHSHNVLATVIEFKRQFDIDVIAGN